MPPIRIAYLTSQYSTVRSGPGRFTQYLKELNDKEFSFTFFSDDVSSPEPNVIKVKRIKFLSKTPGYWVIKFFLLYLSFRKEHAKHPFDFILCSSAYEALFIKNTRSSPPLYVMINDEKYALALKGLRKELSINPLLKIAGRVIGHYTERSVIKKADYVIANSIYTKNLLLKHYKIPEKKLTLLYKAVDLNFFKIKPPRATHAIRNFLFVKNDWRIGGLDIIILALSKLAWQAEVSLNVVGIPDKEISFIINLAKEVGYKGRLKVEGLLKKEDLLHRLYQADLLLLMSRKEALGVSLLEALSCGTPVIASDVGGIPEVLDFGKAGFIIPCGNAEKLTQTLEEINQNPLLLEDKVDRGIMHCRNFSKETLEKNLKALFRRKETDS